MKMGALVAACFLAGILAGCTPPDSPGVEPPQPAVSQEPTVPDVAPTPDEPETPPPPERSLGPCSSETRQAIEDTVVGQVTAFSDGDFEAAYAFASPSFQRGIPLEVFGQIIRTNYPQLLAASNARSGPCDADLAGGVSTIVMRFDTPTDANYTLRYVLELVEEQWRIAGANQETVADTVA
jgi:hypothetical protein